MNDFRYITTSMCCKRRKIPAYVFLDSRGKFRNPSRAELVSHLGCPEDMVGECWPELMDPRRRGTNKETSNGHQEMDS